MILRKAKKEDIPAILDIVEDARVRLRANGTLQWNTPDGYPSAATFEQDIQEDQLYVVDDAGFVCAMAAFCTKDDENYQHIIGKWISNGPYVTIHRIAVKKEYYHKKVSDYLMEQACLFTRMIGYNSIRVDTHPFNEPMRKLLVKFGFKECGHVYLLRTKIDSKRIVYEKKC